MITMNDTQYSISSGMLDSTTYGSLLTFTTALSDDGSQYYCTASYGANETVPQSSLIYPSAATSDNTTVNVESKLSYMYVYMHVVIYNTWCKYVVSNDFIPVHKMDTTNNTLYRAVCCMNM